VPTRASAPRRSQTRLPSADEEEKGDSLPTGQRRRYHSAMGSTCPKTLACCLLLVLGLLVVPARADTLIINNITYANASVSAIDKGELFFTIAGTQVRKPIVQVNRITLNDEPALNNAENAFVAKDWDKAVEGYEKTLRITGKAWLKEWASLRLLDAANQSGRFDSAIRGYIALAERSPASTEAIKLKMPAARSSYLVDAIKLVDAAVAQTKQPASRDVLLSLLVDLHKARGDTTAVEAILRRQTEAKVAEAIDNSPERQAARLKLGQVAAALAQRQYDQVVALVEKQLPSLLDPADQAEALYAAAEAKAAKSIGNTNSDAWKEVALAYMRVVVVAPPGTNLGGQALLKTAAIHETRLDDKATALKVYQQVVAEYPGQEPARAAQQAIARIKG
jgi:tetratricopeptide (TPR) repeat protein